MKDINKILEQDNISDVIVSLKERSVYVPSWKKLVVDYEPLLHKIVEDKQGRKDKIHSDGSKDVAARIPIGLEQLLTKRVTDFTFSIPVKRIYSTKTDKDKEIANAIERIYQSAHVNAENIKRGIAYYASCELFSLWYTRKTPNKLYGFDSEYKLKCKTFSPMDDTDLYPLFDEKEDMIAMSYEYRKKVKDEWVTYFETFTADKHFIWSSLESQDWEVELDGEEIVIDKIPGAYIFRKKPIWHGLTKVREELEYTISRNSDIIAYNSAPILKVAGQIVGEMVKGETRRVYRVQEGGDVSYVSWTQAVESLRYHVDILLRLFFMQAQIPDISFDNMKALGNIGYDARKTLFADAHMKIGEESGAWLEFFERETNVIKAFLKKMNTKWSSDDIDSLRVEHVITPYVQEDELNEIKKWQLANGNKPLISHSESVASAALTENADATYDKIKQEEMADAAIQQAGMTGLLNTI